MDDGSDDVRRPMSVLGAAGWALCVELVFVLVVQLVESARHGAQADLVTLTAGRVLAYALVLFAILRVHEPQGSVRALLGLRRASLVDVLLGACTGGALGPAATWLEERVAARFPPREEELLAAERLLAADTLGKKVALALTLGLVVPVVDELFFRGAIFTPLTSQRTKDELRRALIATALFDTLVLAAPRAVPATLVVMLVLATLRARSGSVLPGVAGRVAFFAVSLAPFVAGLPETPTSGRLAAGGFVAAAAAFGAFLLWTRGRVAGED